MDGTRFDELTRVLAQKRSRRSAIRSLAGAVAGGLLASRVGSSEARRSASSASQPQRVRPVLLPAHSVAAIAVQPGSHAAVESAAPVAKPAVAVSVAMDRNAVGIPLPVVPLAHPSAEPTVVLPDRTAVTANAVMARATLKSSVAQLVSLSAMATAARPESRAALRVAARVHACNQASHVVTRRRGLLVSTTAARRVPNAAWSMDAAMVSACRMAPPVALQMSALPVTTAAARPVRNAAWSMDVATAAVSRAARPVALRTPGCSAVTAVVIPPAKSAVHRTMARSYAFPSEDAATIQAVQESRFVVVAAMPPSSASIRTLRCHAVRLFAPPMVVRA